LSIVVPAAPASVTRSCAALLYCTAPVASVPICACTPASCPTLTASVAAVPAATLVIWRSSPAEPTDASPAEFCAAASPIAV